MDFLAFVTFVAARLDEAEAAADGDKEALRIINVHRQILAEHGHARRADDRCRVCAAVAWDRATRFRAPCPTLRWLGSLFEDHPDYQHALWAPPGSPLAPED